MDKSDAIWTFVDTNVLLHYRWIEDCDWASFGSLRFVIIPLLIRELEKRQYRDDSEKLRERARTLLHRITELFEKGNPATLRNGFVAEAMHSEPAVDFASYSLSREVADDYLIAHLIESSAAGRKTALLSADGAAAFKAKLRGFTVIRPSPDWLLPKELSKTERELFALRSELKGQPRLSLTLDGQEQIDSIEYFVEPLKEWDPEQRSQHWLRVTNALPSIPSSKRLTPSDIEFLTRNQKFMDAWRDYLDSMQSYRRKIFLKLPLAIWNAGTRRADQIHIRCEIETVVEVAVDPPQGPREPAQNVWEFNNERSQQEALPSDGRRTASNPGRLVALTTRSDADISVAEFTMEFAQQEYTTAVTPIYLTFSDIREAQSFKISYEIRAANIGKPVRAQMNVKLSKSDVLSDAKIPPIWQPRPVCFKEIVETK